ncbi:MAG: hypothetical protein JWO98_2180 [Frankiales bacterium]|nr:hypothetical protein [Frankiales bacterium]
MTGAPIVAPALRDLARLANQLENWLRPRLDADDVRVSGLDYPRGSGQSHETILFDARWSNGGESFERGLVVRIKPTSFTVFHDDLFIEQYEIMRALRGQVPVAEVLWLDEDPALLGAPFFVMQKLTGRVPVSHPSYMKEGWVAKATPEQRALIWENGVRTLGTSARVDPQSLDFLRPPGRTVDGFTLEWERWQRFYEFIAERFALPFHLEAMQQLERSAPASRPEGLVWGDARLGNLMFDDEFRVVAMMDWEQPSLGGSLNDLGWWLFNERMKVADNGGRLPSGWGDAADTVALWREMSGRDTADLAWFEAYSAFKCSCLTVRTMELRDQSPPGGDWASLPIARALDGLLRAL